MTLWIILTVLTAIASVGITIPLVRRHDLGEARESGVAILKRQLDDIDAQEKAGTVAAADAEAMRTEVKRRILVEGRVSEGAARALGPKTLPWIAVGLAAVVAIAATGLYAWLGHPQASAPMQSAQGGATDAAGHPVADVSTMIAELEAKLRANPNDAEGWRMLGWSYSTVNRPADAAQAYAHAAALDPNNASYPSAEGDALVNAANGQVTADALVAFKAALRIDPADPRSRYYMALGEDQAGQHDKAMADWIALLQSAPAGAPWAVQVREFVEKLAHDRHVDLTGKLPPATQPEQAAPAQAAQADQAAQAGPSPDQQAAASQMSPGDRQAMINMMVDRLADKLKADPHNADGWMRLMRARMVLGQTDKAAAALHGAEQAFANSPADLDTIKKAAQALGVPGG